MKFTEIFRLKKMLEEANIPFQFSENFNGGFHIVYSFEGEEICSVVEHEFSYGREKDLLEIQGLMTEQEIEEEQDTVLGYLTADNVFGRIKMHWTSSKVGGEKTVMNRLNRFRSGDIVRHFKRTMLTEQELKDNPTAYLYEIVGYGKHTETGEEYVVYKTLYSLRDVHVGEICIRPKDMFESLVDVKKYPNAKQLYRFEVV